MTCFNSIYNSYQKWAIGNDIRNILVADSAVTSQVGAHIYPLVAPEDTNGDFIVYSRTRYSKYNTKEGVYQDDCSVAVVGISDDYDRSVALASHIDNALMGQHKISGNTIEIMLMDSTEEYTDNKYVQTLLFQIK